MHAIQLDADDDGPAQLTITGTIGDDGGSFGLGFALRRKPVAQLIDERLATWIAVDLLGDKDAIRSTTAIPAMPLCAVPEPGAKPPEGLTLLVDSLVPLLDDVRSMVVRSEDGVLLRRTFSGNPPAVDRVTVKSDDATYVISWEAEHPDGLDLEHIVIVSYDDASTWRPTTLPIADTSAAVAVAPSSAVKTLTFAVVTTDGFNTVMAVAEPVEAHPATPQIAILSPSPGLAYSPLAVIACTTEPNESVLLQTLWSSTVDGEIGNGLSPTVKLSTGKHTITAAMIDESGKTIATDSVDLEVQ
jgi:hypothetical protein